MITDQVAQAPSTITPATSETVRLPCAGTGSADAIPVDPTRRPPTHDGPRPNGRIRPYVRGFGTP
ncbi:hypothetical protein GCM10023080_038060 [Streptomyces pseudoechinosporeus]